MKTLKERDAVGVPLCLVAAICFTALAYAPLQMLIMWAMKGLQQRFSTYAGHRLSTA